MGKRSAARYEEIAAYLRRLIAAAEPGDRLPSDAELCERFGVSRMTARHAVQILANEHLLHRQRGRGTFVSQRPVPRLLGSPLSFTESMRRRGMATTSHVVYAGFAAPAEEDVKALGIAADEQVGVLERLRLADGTPMAIERAVVAPRCAPVVELVADSSLHAAFERMGHIPSRARAQVTVRKATAEERRLLELGSDDTLLCERRTIYDHDGLPLEHTETRYAAGRYVFEVMMFRDEHGLSG
jgi:GntR family transcriptional regulator